MNYENNELWKYGHEASQVAAGYFKRWSAMCCA